MSNNSELKEQIKVFKWNEHQIKLSEILKNIDYKPIFGNKRADTHWLVFMKKVTMMNEKDHKADFSFITRMLEDDRKAGYEHGYSVGYNKAINDFLDLISKESHIDLDEDYVDGGFDHNYNERGF